MLSYRLIVCFDIDAESLYDAYGQLVTGLKGVNCMWKTSDEWYDSGKEEPGNVVELDHTIIRYYVNHPR